MAGSYSDVPSRRFAWDDDGTRAFFGRGSGPSADTLTAELSANSKAILNSQDNDFAGPTNTQEAGIFLIFPELREIDGMFVAIAGANVGMFATADNTVTNPFSSGWSQAIAEGSTPDVTMVPNDNYRTQIVSMAETTERGAAAFKNSSGSNVAFRAVHVYGTISPGETPDKIIVIDDATGLEFTAPLDYGDIPRGGSEDYDLRLRNDSASLQANTVQYTVESLGVDGGGNGNMGGGHGWFTATLPGGSTFSGTNQIASIAAATTSGIITLRRITPGDEEPRLFAPRLQVQTASWS